MFGLPSDLQATVDRPGAAFVLRQVTIRLEWQLCLPDDPDGGDWRGRNAGHEQIRPARFSR